MGRRILAAALGIYLALGMGRAALAIRTELGRAESLQNDLSQIRAQLEHSRALSEEELRLWAFRQEGLTAPEDVVFFDAGAWKKPRRSKPEWSLQ